MSTQQKTRPPEKLIQELAALVAVPHFEDVLERHAGLYGVGHRRL